MKTPISLFATLLLLLFARQELAAQAIDIADAIKKGYLTATASGAGGHTGECIQLQLQNISRKRIEVRVPAGQIFEAGDSILQNIMVGKEETFLVESGKSRLGKLFGFCIEASDGSPGEGSRFSLGPLAQGNLLKLAQHLDANKLHQNPSAQFAVWAVSNSERLEGIGDPSLTSFVASLLGKPVPTYHVEYTQPPVDRLLPGQPANWREAMAMNGLFYYDLPADQSVDFGLFDESGNLVHALFKNRLQKKGYHKFRFEFEIKGLEKGKYFARLTSKGAVLKELAVEF